MAREKISKEDLTRERRITKGKRLVRDEGFTIRNAARTVGIPFTTLQNRLNGVVSRKELHASQQLLTVQEEREIVVWICKCDDFGIPPTIQLVEELALPLVQKQDPSVKSLGVNWNRYFKA